MDSIPRRSSAARYIVKVVILTAVYVLAASVSRTGPVLVGSASFVWLPAGVGLAAILLFGAGMWPVIMAGTVTWLLLLGQPLQLSVAFGAVQALEVLLAAFLLVKVCGFDRSMNRSRDLLLLVIVGGGITVLSATFLVVAGRLIEPYDVTPFTRWMIFMAGNIIGVLVVTPAALAWGQEPLRGRVGSRLLWGSLVALPSLAAIWTLISRYPFGTWGYLWLICPVFVAIFWATQRYGLKGSATANLLFAFPLIWGARGLVPAGVGETEVWKLMILPAFIVILCGTSLLVGGVIQANREVSRRFRKVFHSSPLAMTVQSLEDGRFLDVNHAFGAFSGYTREETIGRSAADLGLWAEAGRRQEVFRDFDETGRIRGEEVRLRSKAGETRVCRFFAESLAIYGQECVLVVVDDLTERQQLEEKLAHSQKMEALGSLAGGIAHDFNNLLTVILGSAGILGNVSGLSDADRELTREIVDAAERARSLTQQMLVFGRKQVLEPERIDLNTALSRTEKMLRRLIGEDIELIATFSESPAVIEFDPVQIEQIIINLAVNARDAMPDGGKLDFCVDEVKIDGAPAREVQALEPGTYVRLSVHDTGEGMDEQTLSRIFDPFFTTKDTGKGTGLGLSMAYSIIEQSGGEIIARSIPGSGTTIQVYLPRIDDEPRQLAEEPRVVSPSGECRTVMLVEDQESVRTLTRRILESGGYRVVEATDGSEALSLVRTREDRVDLLLTDVIMPGMKGTELVERFMMFRPDTKVLYMSGYSDDRLTTALESPGSAYLPKPFSPEQLLAKVQELLDG